MGKQDRFTDEFKRDAVAQVVDRGYPVREVAERLGISRVLNSLAMSGKVIPPFLTGCIRRIHAAIFSFWAGVMPPMPMFGRSLLYVHSHCVAKSWASSMFSMMCWSSHSCLTVRL